MQSQFQHRPRRGFTLIELLVVVAIIALLIAILLPSLGKARETAKRTACAANMHSISNALATYTGSFEGALPPAAITWTSGVGFGVFRNRNWYDKDQTTSVPIDFTPNLWRYHNNNGLVLLNTAGNFLADTKAFYCPSSTWAGYNDDANERKWTRADGQIYLPNSGSAVNGHSQYFGYAYQLHSNANPYGRPYVSAADTAPRFAPYNKTTKFPAASVALGSDILYQAAILPHGKNGDQVNVFFSDGHAATVSGSIWKSGTVSATNWSSVAPWVAGFENGER